MEYTLIFLTLWWFHFLECYFFFDLVHVCVDVYIVLDNIFGDLMEEHFA